MLLASSTPVLAQSAGTPAQPPGPVATAAPAAPRNTLPARNCTAIRTEDPTTVTLGKSVVIPLSSPMARILVSGQTPGAGQAAAPMAANSQPQMQNGMGDIEVQLLSPRDLFFRGRKSGSMNVILQNAQGTCFIKDVIVTMDPGPLQTKLSELMPEERGIRVQGADNALVLSGEISNPLRLDDVVTLAGAYSDSKKIVNLLRTTSPHQVMLEVKIAEVSKTLLDKLGASFAKQAINGQNTYTIASNFLSGGSALLSALRIGKASLNIDGQKDDGLVRILAEPNIMAISGQQASFLSGGKIFIPVSQSNANGVPVMTLEEKEFGIGVKFTPTVLGSSRVNLKLVSEVSDLSQTGSPFTAINGATSVIPSLSVRRADTTVQLNDGQSLVIAGLIKNNITEAVKRFPGLGEIPVLGALARSTEFQTDQTELMFIITPRLVQALAEAPRVPTDNHVPPSRAERYLNGALESSEPAPAAKTAPAATMPATTATPVQAPVPTATPQELQPQAPVEPSVDRPAPLNPPT
ncbi:MULTISPECIES: type II and III secretion system protein family protein [Comamonas]|uniref:type II and III secretion system protein family protein n=1 Tax=Comamonas TaxID=283 RepID=UPI00050FA0E0|nr:MULTISPECIES: type II and III secretion system protein [Comamonas]KGG91874.1 type II and III secretion system protein [Comamonas thiooxydans]KGG95381.1 type II and III secretion system protein [Comamonas thiooxydans]KGH07953.1 type II and III secretion system protein [Comamonas thiooxydans]KGH15482.1 type II and III secretion system protein [Comamonas thiooxydans]TZG07221.1 type II and III secretion system protein family protein [Comamonas thiooxydans]